MVVFDAFYDHIGGEFADLQSDVGIFFQKPIEEEGEEVGCQRGYDADPQFSFHMQGFFFYNVVDAFNFPKYHLGLGDEFFANFSWHHWLFAAVEYLDLEFVFQFFNHHAECCLGDVAVLSRCNEVTKAVHGDDVF